MLFSQSVSSASISSVCAPLDPVVLAILFFMITVYTVDARERRSSTRRSARIGNFMGNPITNRIVVLVLLFMSIASTAQKKSRNMVGSAAKATDPATVKVVPDLARRVAKFRSVSMSFADQALTLNEKKMVGKL